MPMGIPFSPDEAETIKVSVIEWLLKTPMGTITEACHQARIAYSTFWEWQDKEPELKKAVKAAMRVAHEMGGDFAESKLRLKIQNDDTVSILFYLKTQHKDRGYVEKQLVDSTQTITATNENKNINLTPDEAYKLAIHSNHNK